MFGGVGCRLDALEAVAKHMRGRAAPDDDAPRRPPAEEGGRGCVRRPANNPGRHRAWTAGTLQAVYGLLSRKNCRHIAARREYPCANSSVAEAPMSRMTAGFLCTATLLL